MGFWLDVQTNHLTANYVMKTDDDTFVRVDVILSLVRSRDINESSLLGEVEMVSSPSRDPTSKWFITFEVNTTSLWSSY